MSSMALQHQLQQYHPTAPWQILASACNRIKSKVACLAAHVSSLLRAEAKVHVTQLLSKAWKILPHSPSFSTCDKRTILDKTVSGQYCSSPSLQQAGLWPTSCLFQCRSLLTHVHLSMRASVFPCPSFISNSHARNPLFTVANCRLPIYRSYIRRHGCHLCRTSPMIWPSGSSIYM